MPGKGSLPRRLGFIIEGYGEALQCFEQENDAVHESRASVWLKNGKLSGRLEYGEGGGQGWQEGSGYTWNQR